MKKKNSSLYAYILAVSAYYEINEKYPPKNSDITDLAISVICGITNYAECKVVANWVRKGDIDRADGRGLSKKNFIALINQWAGKNPFFATAEDIRYFANCGRAIYVKWVYSQKFKSFCAEKNLPDGPLSPYWATIQLPLPSIWHSLDLDNALVENIKNQPTEVVERLTTWIEETPAKSRTQMANVFSLLSFSTEAISMAIEIIERRKWTWGELLIKLENQTAPTEIPDVNKGVQALVTLIYKELSSNRQEQFVFLGAFPQLRSYKNLCFETLWQLPKEIALKDELAFFEEWRLLQPIGKEKWKITENVLKMSKLWLTELPVSQKKKAKEWRKRYLKNPREMRAFQQTIRIKEIHAHNIVSETRRTIETRKAYQGYKREKTWERLIRVMICTFTTKICDSDANYFEENSRYLDSGQYLYSYFLLDQWKRAVLKTVLESAIVFILFKLPSQYLRIFAGILTGHIVITLQPALRAIRLERAWLVLWKDVHSQLSKKSFFL